VIYDFFKLEKKMKITLTVKLGNISRIRIIQEELKKRNISFSAYAIDCIKEQFNRDFMTLGKHKR